VDEVIARDIELEQRGRDQQASDVAPVIMRWFSRERACDRAGIAVWRDKYAATATVAASTCR